MRIKCIKILNNRPNRKDLGKKTEDLKVGKEYIVLCLYYGQEGVLYFQFEGDSGGLFIFEADQFEVLSNYVPSNWEITTKCDPDGRYYLKLSPQSWNSYVNSYKGFDMSFYEEITEVTWPLKEWRGDHNMPDVVKLFFREKDRIHREEKEYRLKHGGGKIADPKPSISKRDK